jgi:hypothetical protein
MKAQLAYQVDENSHDQFFGFYLDAWIFVFLLAILIIFSFITITIAKTTKRIYFEENRDKFVEENGYSYDYVFVFEVYQEDKLNELNEFQQKYTLKNIIDRMENAKLEMKCFYSCQRDEIYVKVRAPPIRLLQEADRVDYKLALHPMRLHKACKEGAKDGKWAGFIIRDEINYSSYNPYQHIYAKYDQKEELQDIYRRYAVGDKAHILRPVDRIKLLMSIFEANTNASDGYPGCGLQLGTIVFNEVVLAHFPLHDYHELADLEKTWLKLYSNKPVPLSKFSEKSSFCILLFFS